MTTLKAVQLRMKSVHNIRKITRSMKLVSASKYARAERELRHARPMGEGAKLFYEKAEVTAIKDPPQRLFIAVCSDKGLAGAIHVNICRSLRTHLETEGPDVKLVIIGDKARNLLHRSYRQYFLLCANKVGRKNPSFNDACIVANGILRSGYRFNSGKILYSKYRNIVNYKTTDFPLFGVNSVLASPKVAAYDNLDMELLQSYTEYSLACLLYYAMKESSASEHSARMNAMENANKNAGEMLSKLTIRYNRGRQSAITKEMCEIVSGAAAV